MLEKAVFKKDKTLGRTIFDDFQDRLAQMSSTLNDGILKIQDQVQESESKMAARFFEQDVKVKQVLAVRGQIEINMNDIKGIKDYNENFSNKLLAMLDEVKTSTLKDLKGQQQQLSMARDKLDRTFTNLTILDQSH